MGKNEASEHDNTKSAMGPYGVFAQWRTQSYNFLKSVNMLILYILS